MFLSPGFWPIPADVDNVVVFLIVGSLSAMLFSISKAGFGGGLGMLSVPLMIYACGTDAASAKLALGIMLPILIAADYVAVIHWWKHWQWKTILPLLPGVGVGVVVAWLAILSVQRLDEAGEATVGAVLKIAVGLIALTFVGLFVVQKLRGKQLAFRPTVPQALAVGTVAGFTSTLGHAAGPVAAMYLLPQDMPKSRYVATTALLFWCVNQIKLPFYLQLGLVNPESLGAGLVLLPAIIVGGVLGVFLHRRIGQKNFRGIVFTLLTLAGGHLLYQGIRALIP